MFVGFGIRIWRIACRHPPYDGAIPPECRIIVVITCQEARIFQRQPAGATG
jgi:hypothetical protein